MGLVETPPGIHAGGEILFEGEDLLKKNEDQMRQIRGNKVAMIFQEPMTALNPVLRIRSQMYEAFEGEKLTAVGPMEALPAGAGNVPEANYKMIAALSVMKGQIERADIPKFVAERGMPGFVPTQGHIPSGVPYIGHALEALKAGTIKRAMIIGKGSLFLGRLTNLADGASFIMEGPA